MEKDIDIKEVTSDHNLPDNKPNMRIFIVETAGGCTEEDVEACFTMLNEGNQLDYDEVEVLPQGSGDTYKVILT